MGDWIANKSSCKQCNKDVGKTSIISQFKDNVFSSTCLSTPGATFVSKQISINDTDIDFEIWDTAGQEKYRSLTRIFYKDTHVALLVYDITKRKTFIEIKEFWLKEIQSNAPKAAIVFIIGNKHDMFVDEEVPEEEGRKLAEDEKAFFALVSAKNSFDIQELFKQIGKKHLAEYWRDNEEIAIEVNQRKEIRKHSVSLQYEKSNSNITAVTKKKCC